MFSLLPAFGQVSDKISQTWRKLIEDQRLVDKKKNRKDYRRIYRNIERFSEIDRWQDITGKCTERCIRL